jgi:molybdate transport system substrate-binding protein
MTTLKIFSAGAVSPPLQKALKLYEEVRGTRCDLKAGKPENLLIEIVDKKEGDLISTGAEYVIDDAEDRGITLPGKRRSLGLRRSVIIVPKGNPAGIQSLADLCRPGVRIGVATEGCLKGLWDDVASKAGLTDAIRRNITDRADSCGAVMALVNTMKVDAIFGWNAFKNLWPATCDAVELPQDLQVFRSTAAAVVRFSSDVAETENLLGFLASERSKKVYAEFGWLHR